jgi:hypothetical protein
MDLHTRYLISRTINEQGNENRTMGECLTTRRSLGVRNIEFGGLPIIRIEAKEVSDRFGSASFGVFLDDIERITV